MEITFTKNEYRNLIKMLYIAEWIIHGHDNGKYDDNDEEKNTKIKGEFKIITEKILSYSKENNCEDLVNWDSKELNYHFTKKIEEGIVRKIVEKYDMNNLLMEIPFILAEKELIKKYGSKKVEKMSTIEYFYKSSPLIQRYEEEISKNGLLNLEIINENLEKDINKIMDTKELFNKKIEDELKEKVNKTLKDKGFEPIEPIEWEQL